MNPVEELFVEVDRLWGLPANSRITLRIIGSAALMLQSDFQRGTKDGDVLETAELQQETMDRLRALAGTGTELQRRRRMYVDIVPRALPFLPEEPCWHPLTSLNKDCSHLSLEVLDVTDVVVSKFKRFLAPDQNDIGAMIDRNLVRHDRLVKRFQSAITGYLMDARAEDLPRYIKNFHRVERDIFCVDETEFELPPWL